MQYPPVYERIATLQYYKPENRGLRIKKNQP